MSYVAQLLLLPVLYDGLLILCLCYSSCAKSPVNFLSPTQDRPSPLLSQGSPAPSPSGERKLPPKPIPYSEHKRLASPGVVKKAGITDTVPTKQPNSCGKVDLASGRPHVPTRPSSSDNIDGLFSRPRLPTPKLETMTPRPYEQRSGSVSSVGSPTAPRSRSGSHSTSEARSNQSPQGAANEQRQASSQPPVPVQKPRDRPRPALRPKSVAVQRPSPAVTNQQSHESAEDRNTQPVVHPGVQLPVDGKDRPSDRGQSPASIRKIPPVPAPRSAASPRIRRAENSPCSAPRPLSNLEPGEKAKRPDGSPVTRPRTRPKPAGKPKRIALTMYEKSTHWQDEKLSAPVQPDETRSADQSKSTGTDKPDQSLVQAQLDNGLKSKDVSGQISTHVSEATPHGSVTDHHDSASAVSSLTADVQHPPIMFESSLNSQISVETTEPTESLASQYVNPRVGIADRPSETSSAQFVVAGDDSSSGYPLVTGPCNSQDEVFESSATPVETAEENEDVGSEKRHRSGTATQFSGSIIAAAAALQSALGGSSVSDQSSLLPEHPEGVVQQSSHVGNTLPVLSSPTKASSDSGAPLSPSKHRRKAPPPPASFASRRRGLPSPAGSPAASPSGMRKLPLSQSGQTPPPQQKVLPAVNTASSPAQSPSGKRKAAPSPPTRMSSIENALPGSQPVNSSPASSPSGQRKVGPPTLTKVLSIPTRQLPGTSPQFPPIAPPLAISPVQPGQSTAPARAPPSYPPTSGPPSRPPPPKPPRSVASHSVPALSPVAQQQQPQFPPTVNATHVSGQRVLVQQSDSFISMTSEISVVSDEYDEDSDGCGSEFDSDSQEEVSSSSFWLVCSASLQIRWLIGLILLAHMHLSNLLVAALLACLPLGYWRNSIP